VRVHARYSVFVDVQSVAFLTHVYMADWQVLMAKEEGSKTVVIGGKKDVSQQYCGTVGGQSTDFSTMDTDIKVSTSFFFIGVLAR
jgi:hypothetical protein